MSQHFANFFFFNFFRHKKIYLDSHVNFIASYIFYYISYNKIIIYYREEFMHATAFIESRVAKKYMRKVGSCIFFRFGQIKN